MLCICWGRPILFIFYIFFQLKAHLVTETSRFPARLFANIHRIFVMCCSYLEAAAWATLRLHCSPSALPLEWAEIFWNGSSEWSCPGENRCHLWRSLVDVKRNTSNCFFSQSAGHGAEINQLPLRKKKATPYVAQMWLCMLQTLRQLSSFLGPKEHLLWADMLGAVFLRKYWLRWHSSRVNPKI